MKKCSQCGRAYSDLVNTCSYCGAPLNGGATSGPAQKQQPRQTYTPPVQPNTQPVRPITPPVQPVPCTPPEPLRTPPEPIRPPIPPVPPGAPRTAVTENVGKGILGAMLFGLGGAAVQALILNMGKVAAIAGILCFFLTKAGYKKFSGIGESTSKAATWICAPISLGMLFLGTVAGYAIFVANSLGVGIGEALDMVLNVSELTEAMGSDMASSVVMWAASVVLSLFFGRKKK